MKLFVYAIVFLVLTFNTSCLKKQNLDDDDLGTPFDAALLNKAMTDGFGSLNYGNIKSNEFSSYILTQTIQDTSFSPLEQQDLTIETSTDTTEKLTLDLVLSKIKYAEGQSSQSTRKWHQVFGKTGQSTASNTEVSSLADNDPPTFLFIAFQGLAFDACHPDAKSSETCYQLQVTDFKYRVPQTAASQHDCADTGNCLINARRIEFDMIQNKVIDKDGKPKRTHYTVIVSNEVPYLSRVLKYCSRSLYEISSLNQKILADFCYDINNYAFGNK